MLVGIVLSAFNLRTAVTSLTPLLDQLGRIFGFGTTMTGVLGMMPTAAFALFGVLTPRIAHRIGLERTALLSMVMATAGLLLRSAAGGTENDVIIGHDWGAIAGTGLAAMPDSPFTKAVIMSVPP